MKQQTICIVGLGLLGGSYAMGLTRAGVNITAIDLRQSAIDYAIAHDIIAGGTTDASEFPALLGAADAVVLGLYPHAVIQWLREYQPLLRAGALITDVSGVKTGIVSEVQSFLREDVEFIGSHPMAGKEVSGVEFADCAIFKAANFIITPTERNTADGIAFAKSLAETLEFAHIVTLSCAEHDKMIGYVSQLTHAIAVSLMNASDNAHLAEYTGDSFRDLTRIAHINETLWSELFLLNKNILTTEIDQFIAALETLKTAVKTDDDAALKQLFVQSTERHRPFEKK